MISLEELIQMMTVVEVDDCPYLPDRKERLRALRCPGLPNDFHAELMKRGFRHSGDIFYIPECENCNCCIPMRIDPKLFKPSKKQRHIFNKNADIEIRIQAPSVTEEKLELFQKYTEFQHPDAAHKPDMKSLKSLFKELPSTAEVQYWIGDELAGITIADIIPNEAFSSVYHFFNPAFSNRSIGVFSMIAEIRITELMEIPYYYPGFWVPGCRKMEYKCHYRPNQLLVNGEWIDHDDNISFG